ncbi:phage capsid protein [Enterococcus entomosocium]|uniref:phage capsid protein n=1 Tax=Enterococcus entomosocium TaxID=3034352 RepID=UPI0026489F9B|nr:phage capsid protein [Enterococcus entomosocium]
MIKTRDQYIFDEMFKKVTSLGYKAYDFKPLNDIGYPFVEFEGTDIDHDINKTNVLGNVTLVISVWGLQKKRKEVSDMAANIFNAAMEVKETDGYSWALNIQTSGIRILDDVSTNTPLKRARLSLEFKQTGGI